MHRLSTSASVGLGANGGIYLTARDFVVNPATNFNGSVEIAHTGSPQAIVANSVAISGTTGLSFGTGYFQRVSQ